MQRVISAIILAPLTILSILYSPLWVFSLIISIVALLAVDEFFKISEAAGVPCFRGPGYISVMLIPLFDLYQINLTYLFSILLIFLFCWALVEVKLLKEMLGSVASTLAGVLYTGFFLSFLIPIRRLSLGSRYLIFLMIVIWVGDTFAYYVGKTIGRHSLAPHLSPKKTIEGSIAGFAASILAAYIVHRIWPLDLSSQTVIALSAILNIAGQIGDLAESALKRGAQMKDSSKLIPGHGGVLDRIDSLLFSAPIMYILLKICSEFSFCEHLSVVLDSISYVC